MASLVTENGIPRCDIPDMFIGEHNSRTDLQPTGVLNSAPLH